MFTPPYYRHKLSLAKGSPNHQDQPHLSGCVPRARGWLCMVRIQSSRLMTIGLSIWQAGKSTQVSGQLKFTWKRFRIRCGQEIWILKILSITFSLSTLVYLGRINFGNKHLGSRRPELSQLLCMPWLTSDAEMKWRFRATACGGGDNGTQQSDNSDSTGAYCVLSACYPLSVGSEPHLMLQASSWLSELLEILSIISLFCLSQQELVSVA